MAHLRSIGLNIEPHLIFELLDQIVKNGTRTKTAHGDYVSWNAGLGPEAWVYLDGMSLQSMATHFSGVSRIRCRLNNELHRENQEAQQVALQGWLAPTSGVPGGDCPIVFDCPDYHVHGAPAFPHECEVQFALFPINVSRFGSESEWFAAQSGKPRRIPSRSIVASAASAASDGGVPRSEVTACGRVVQTNLMTNALTGGAFVAVQIETNKGIFDLALPDERDSRDLRPENYLGGIFWISGRLLRSGGPPPLPKI